MLTLMPQDIARVAHEANRAYCCALGDNSQHVWEQAPEWQQASAIAGVHFHMLHPDASPADSHNSWMREKTADGWGWGPVKDPVAKLHPCFLPYDQLPQEQRAKDHVFGAIAKSMIALMHAGGTIA